MARAVRAPDPPPMLLQKRDGKKVPPVLYDVEDAQPSALDVAQVRLIADEVVRLDEEIERLTQQVKDLSDNRRRLVEETLPNLFDQCGRVDELKLDNGWRIKLQKDYYPNCTDENRPAFFSWLRKNNLEGIIKNVVAAQLGKGEDEKAIVIATFLRKQKIEFTQKESVHPSTLKAFVRERLVAEKPLPPVLDINEVRHAVIKLPKEG